MGYLSEPIHGLPCRLDGDNPMAMAEELETVRKMTVNLDHGLQQRLRLLTVLSVSWLKREYTCLLYFLVTEGWEN